MAMNFKARARRIVLSAMPRIIHSGGQRIDMTAWQDELIAFVERGLKQAATDAHRKTMRASKKLYRPPAEDRSRG